jgi:processive 1,2-diacylglycerol beta-glucosyltransferase/1,2-diacylglycerol 3-beta-galactosyltransferase
MSSEEINEEKSRLNFDLNKKLILILGGGDGIPKGKRILQELLGANLSAQIAMVCGKNNALLKSANKLKEEYKADNLKIYGYVDFIYELINVCDVVITKCGASTIMEILNLGRVSVVNDYIWEQEQGNIDYLIDKKLGIYEPDVKKLSGIIKNLFADEGFYSFYKTNIENENIKNGVKEVSEFLIAS